MGYPRPNGLQRDNKYFRETFYSKKIRFYLKLTHAIYYSDNLKTCLALILGHSWVTSDRIDLNRNTRIDRGGPVNDINI